MQFTMYEIRFLIDAAKSNRDNSTVLAFVPGQVWASAHLEEVRRMEELIPKLETIMDQIADEIDSAVERYLDNEDKSHTQHDGLPPFCTMK